MRYRAKFWSVVGPTVVVAILALSGCEDGLTEVNENPNSPEEVPVENLLLGGIWDVNGNSGNRGVFGQWTQLYHAENWAQHVAQPVYNDEDRYTPRTGVIPQIWDEMYFALTDLAEAKAMADAQGEVNIWAAAEIMTVYGFMLLTDYYGDIPYEQALSLDEDIMFPEYTPQEDIYPDLISRLETAAGMIDPIEEDFGAFEPIYQGDMADWRRFANSLRLRLAVRMSGSADAPTGLAGDAATMFADAWSSDIFTSVEDNADVDWTGQQPSANPVYEGIVLAGRTGDFRMSQSLIDRMNDTSDPRLPIYAEPAESDGEYRGLRNGREPSDDGLSASDFSTMGEHFLSPTSPSTLLSYAEVLLLGAEAAERGWIGEDPAALYESGIEASMRQYGIDQADIDAYLEQASVSYDSGTYTGLDAITYQKWVALYMAGPEAYADLRRVDWLDLEPADNSVLDPGLFPERLYYPPDEALYNPVNYPGDIPITEPVWWAGG